MTTYPSDQGNPTGAIPTYSVGGALIVPTPVNAVPATVAGGATYTTGAMSTRGCRGLAASAQMTQAGVLMLQRYIDAAGSIPIGLPITQAMTAGVLATVAVNDGLPAASWSVSVSNSSGSVGTLSNVNFLAQG